MSKRILVIVLTVCLAVVGMTVMAFADIASGTDWVLANDGTLTISSDDGMYDWATNGYRSRYGSYVKSVVIQSGVTDIDDYAFYYYCTNLESVSIPDTVTTIGKASFDYCKSLTSITIPDSVETIGENAFGHCESLTSITIPGSVKTISKSAFYYCTSLATVTLGSSVETIGDSAFAGTSLTSIVIPDSVTTLGSYAFSECLSLTSATIGSGVTTLDYTFSLCTSLTSVYIGGSVTAINSAFYLNYTYKDVRSITDIYYSGTETEWNNITKTTSGMGDNSADAFIHYNCTSIHTYTLEPDFTWSSDYSTCTVALACSVCGAVKEESLSCNVTDDITPAVSCAEDGVAVYTATYTYDGVDYEDVQTVILTIPHTLAHTEAKSATCTEDGNIEYWYCSECGKYFSDEDCTIEITDTTTLTLSAIAHSYYVSSCTWYDNYTSATLKLVCDSCGDEIEIDATEITSEEDGSGNVVYKATVRYGNINYSQITTVEAEKKSSSKSDIYTTLSRIQASYTGVQAAIEKANSLNPDDYENFSAVTEAIEAVDWSLNVLNQKAVNAYAEAIEEAIENLVPVETVDITEETIEVVDPVEAGETDSE
ncbi:MAG: leucine-rich repeat domain-containing protein [Ruminococcus sp.]|nr:leucine-rich repeat domain-containing protein [Ruminococcus sp.]